MIEAGTADGALEAIETIVDNFTLWLTEIINWVLLAVGTEFQLNEGQVGILLMLSSFVMLALRIKNLGATLKTYFWAFVILLIALVLWKGGFFG